MRAAHALVVASLLGATAFGEPAVSPCGTIAEVPRARARFEKRNLGPPLRRVHSLLRRFSEGDGVQKRSDGAPPSVADGVGLYPLPWDVASERSDRSRLVTWQDRERANDESMLALVLHAGESWCTSPLELPEGSRLRFEAVSLGRTTTEGRLTVEPGGKAAIFSGSLARPTSLDASRQTDLPLDAGTSSLCFRAAGASVAVGEPRVVAPERPGGDERPRWLVLTIVDTLRGDLLRGKDAARLAPAMERLRTEGHHYEKAISPGCHTRAAVWPILMGRDLMRIDPRKRRQSMPIQSPLDAVYSRANLFVSHLAEAAGYHSVFLGNNAYLRAVPAFSRYSSWGGTGTGTVDTIAKLPDLFSRYADERILLVYYVSTPHAQSEIPRRLYEELGCSALEGMDECRCGYDARVRHADEAVESLQEGLDGYGLKEEALQVLTADHGELFGDGRKLEGELPTFATGERRGAYQRFDRGHGSACHEKESDVPLLVFGKGIAPATWEGPVSGLDVVPTLLSAIRLGPVGKLDGVSLPLSSPRAPRARPIVSYGFCSDSRLDSSSEPVQLVWWMEGCRVRDLEGRFLGHRAEIWRSDHLLGTDRSTPDRVRPLMETHERWLREKLPADAFVFGILGMEETTVTLTVEDGRIVDYGPSSTVYGLEGVDVLRAAPDGSEIEVRFRGYGGLYHVSTLPPRAKMKVAVPGRPDVLTFVGPLQLPLSVSGVALDPVAEERFLFAPDAPAPRRTSVPALRLWWQPYGASGEPGSARELSDFDRVLREWGYIR